MIDLRFTIYDLRFKLILLTAYCLLLTAPAHAEIIDRIVAVVNDSAITLSELDAATAGLGGIKGDDKEKKKRII